MWAETSVFYQIYPLGFCGAPEENNGVTVPRIRKLAQWSDYLVRLGVDTLLLNPVFQSDRHGYDTRDFAELDCRLGTNEDFRAVCDTLHGHGLRVVLDGVFNHVGRGFWAFQDVLERREESPCKDWFFLRFDGDNGYHDGLYYEGWEGHYELVKLNLGNPDVRAHLFSCIRGWVESFGIDGLRLDVAYCLDREFLRELRRFCRSLKPDFFLVGEQLGGDYRSIVNEEMLDSCTNYECYKGLFSSFNDANLFELNYALNRQFSDDPYALYRGLPLLSFADNHDVTRLGSILRERRHLPLAYALLFGMPGIPCLYYGSEWGAPGEKKDGDHSLRPCFAAPEENELSQWVAQLVHVRRASRALCQGGYCTVALTNRQLVFVRTWSEERVLVAVNLDSAPATVALNAWAGAGEDLMTGEGLTLAQQQVLPPFSAHLWRLGNC